MTSTPNLAAGDHPSRDPVRRRRSRRREPDLPRREPAPEVTLSPDECRLRREALGLSIDELARRAGREPRTVERFEAATVRPRPVTIVALRNALRRAETDQAQQAAEPVRQPRPEPAGQAAIRAVR